MARPRKLAGVFLLLVFTAIGFWGPLSQPGYEAALVAGLVCPTTAAVVTALELLPRRLGAFASLAHATVNAVSCVLLVFLVTVMHGLRTGLCDVSQGATLFLLGPGLGTVLGAIWGGMSAEFGRRWGGQRPAVLAVLLAVGGPVASLIGQLVLLYATPVVFAYDPFIGYFAGPLYDTVIGTDGLSRYRLSTLTTLVAVYVLTLHLERRADGKGWRYRSLQRPGLLVLAGLCGVHSLVDVARGPQLGHWQTAGTIADALGAAQRIGACHIIHAQSIPPEEIERFGRDCNGHLLALTDWLKTTDPRPVTAYLFESAAQKRRLLGAARTSVAKPWRREVYLQQAAYPHPVIGHELVHAMAAEHARGPFGVAGSWGGWLPNPGLVEGIAVAAAPPRGDLGPHQWAAAMYRIDVLPRLEQLFGLDFLANNASASYTAAGSFVSFVRKRYGPDIIISWYGGAGLSSLTKRSWSELQGDWWSMLDALPVSDRALAQARARFDRPGVLARRCPHVVDAQLVQANDHLQQGDLPEALHSYRRVLSLDPSNGRAKLALARCQDRLGDTAQAEITLKDVSQSGTDHARTKQRAWEKAGDLALRTGRVEEARASYQQARALTVNIDRLRTLDVKQYYADQPVARQALLALLVGTSARGPVPSEALDYLGVWRTQAERDGTADYLLARQHFATSNYALGTARLREALARPIPVSRVVDEAWRLALIAACARADQDDAHRALAQYMNRRSVSRTRKYWAKLLVGRCARVAH